MFKCKFEQTKFEAGNEKSVLAISPRQSKIEGCRRKNPRESRAKESADFGFPGGCGSE